MRRKSGFARSRGIHPEPPCDEDLPEYDRIKGPLVDVLRKYGGYEPGVDDLHVDTVASVTMRHRKGDVFLDSGTATERKYAQIIDAQVKLRKTIDNALRELAITRRDRLEGRTVKSIENELQEAILKAKANADK